jgi:deoxyribose-phosphate aldolase
MPGDDGAGKTCRTAVRRTLQVKNNRISDDNRIRELIAAGRSRVGTSSGLAVFVRVCGDHG